MSAYTLRWLRFDIISSPSTIALHTCNLNSKVIAVICVPYACMYTYLQERICLLLIMTSKKGNWSFGFKQVLGTSSRCKRFGLYGCTIKFFVHFCTGLSSKLSFVMFYLIKFNARFRQTGLLNMGIKCIIMNVF